MAVYHHHGDQHSSPSRVKRKYPGSEPNSAANIFHQCLQDDLLLHNPRGAGTADLGGGNLGKGNRILTVKAEPEWEDRVCTTTTLDSRVQELLKALDNTCPDHQVCQILSPEVLRRLARPELCREEARRLWKHVFHDLNMKIRDFSDVLQHKFDIGDYSLEETKQQNQRCKVSRPPHVFKTYLNTIHIGLEGNSIWTIKPN